MILKFDKICNYFDPNRKDFPKPNSFFKMDIFMQI